MSELTSRQYDQAVGRCKDIFLAKMQDYGSAWRVLRPSSITDQIFIKAQRIRSLEVKLEKKIDEGIEGEYIGIVNYAVIALIQISLKVDSPMELDKAAAQKFYEKHLDQSKSLMLDKNHDYGEAWRDMRVSSMTDLILMKILRTKQIEDNKGNTLISEGVDANYYDMINYAIFALIKLQEAHDLTKA